MPPLILKQLASRYKVDDEETIIEIGFDEAGRGCFFGPITAGAVIWPNKQSWDANICNLSEKIRDSKKLSPKRRSEYADAIRQLIPYWGIGIVHANEINENGIQWANREAFRRALKEVWSKVPESSKIGKEVRLVVDGEISFCQSDAVELEVPWTEEILVIEGDGYFLGVAAASILAKVSHDNWIENWIQLNNTVALRYDMAGSKGYGTSKHREGLGRWGSVEGHRTLFVRRWLPDSDGVVLKEKTKIEIGNEMCLIRI